MLGADRVEIIAPLGTKESLPFCRTFSWLKSQQNYYSFGSDFVLRSNLLNPEIDVNFYLVWFVLDSVGLSIL